MAAITKGGVNAIFQQALGRAATASELKYWTGKEKSKLTTALAAGGSSKEFKAMYGPDAGSTTPPPPPPPVTGDPVYDNILKNMNDLLDEMKSRGQNINPNIEITPEQAAEFMKIAEKEINPYYATQLSLAREGFLSSVGYTKDQILNNEAQLERQYGLAQKQVAANAAETGFALSGKRQQEEQNLALDAQNQIDTQRNELSQRSNELARAFAQTYGGQTGFDINTSIPEIDSKPMVGIEGFKRSGQRSGLYQLSPDLYNNLVGSEEFNRRGALRNRASELESAFRQGKSLDQLRALTL